MFYVHFIQKFTLMVKFFKTQARNFKVLFDKKLLSLAQIIENFANYGI